MLETRFSVRLPSGTPIELFRSAAILAEQSGFDQIWTGNDLFRRSGIVPVAVALDSTSRIRIGSSVLNPVSMHPAEIAMIAANLQELSGGRYLLGLGAGSEVFLRWAGLEPDSPVARTRRALVEIRALLAGASPAGVPGAGAGWQQYARLKDGPALPTPIYLGAMGPKMLSLAGRLADGVLALCLPPDRFGWISDRVAEGIDRRDVRGAVGGAVGGDVDVACSIWVAIDDDADVARRILAGKIAAYAGSLAPAALVDAGLDPERFARVQERMNAGETDAAIALMDEDMLALGVAGDIDAVAERCAELLASGVRHLSFGQPLGTDPLRAIAQLGESVLPRLRKEPAFV